MRNRHRFRTTLYLVGINRCIDVPPEVSRALGGAQFIPVRGTAGGIDFVSTLTPRGAGCHRLFLHSRIWRVLGLDRGDTVSVTLERSATPRVPPMPPELRQELARRPGAHVVFDALTDALRREFLRWLAAAKRPETLERRIQVGLDHLEERYYKRQKQKPG